VYVLLSTNNFGEPRGTSTSPARSPRGNLLKRALVIGGISLAVVLMMGVAAFASSLGKRIAHDSDHGRNPHVSAFHHVTHPRGLAVKVRANPAKPVDVLYKVNCHPG
jgi:hypothetical protein